MLQPTFFSMEQSPKRQPNWSARLTMSASIHSDFPELGTPVMMVSSPGTTCIIPKARVSQRVLRHAHTNMHTNTHTNMHTQACMHKHAFSPSLAHEQGKKSLSGASQDGSQERPAHVLPFASILDLHRQLAYHALLPVSGNGLVHMSGSSAVSVSKCRH